MSHAAEPRETLSPMKTGRSEIAVAQLDGKVYVAGGIGFFKVLKSCEVFIVAKNSWSKLSYLAAVLARLSKPPLTRVGRFRNIHRILTSCVLNQRS